MDAGVFGLRLSGFMIGIGGATAMALAGYCQDVCIGTVSVFFLLVLAQRFFGDASYAIIGPYLAEIWPNRLRGSGMGFGYGIGNLGKIIGPLALAVIVGSSNYVSPQVTLDAIFPSFLFLSYWYAEAALAFLVLKIETKGRSIEEIGRMLDGDIDQNSRGSNGGHRRPGRFDGRPILIITRFRWE